ncbi:hypothetical protein QJS66_18515 [Kocuria rhizophila]|nr:hypothetical protein QJS66_18515 [Kocuria rhizophila]
MAILEHLMIGSEGTLGFVASATLRTVPVHPHVATGLLVFPTVVAAASAVPELVGSHCASPGAGRRVPGGLAAHAGLARPRSWTSPWTSRPRCSWSTSTTPRTVRELAQAASSTFDALELPPGPCT